MGLLAGIGIIWRDALAGAGILVLERVGLRRSRASITRRHAQDALALLCDDRLLACDAGAGRVAEGVLDIHEFGAVLCGGLHHALERLLLERVVLLAHDRAEPVGVLDARHGVLDLLARGGDRNNLLDGHLEALSVVPPVDDGAHVDVVGDERTVLEPAAQVVHLDRRLRVEDVDRDGALGDGRVERVACDHKLGGDPRLLEHLRECEEVCDAFDGGDRLALLRAELGEGLRHRLLLGEEFEQVLVVHIGALGVEHVEPSVSHLGNAGVALVEGGAREEGAVLEDLRLEHLDQLELAAALELEALELGEGAVVFVDRVALLEELALLRGGWEDHRLVWAVDLEVDRHLALLLPLAVDEHLVLRVVADAVDVHVEHDARVRDCTLWLLWITREHLDVLGEALGEDAPDAVRVELERLADLLHQRARLLDDVGARVRDDARHLHRVPARAAPHHVAVERVEDALVGELEGVVEGAHGLGPIELRRLARLLRRHTLLAPLLVERLVLVPPVAEGAHRVNVEGVLALAGGCGLELLLGGVGLLVHLLAVLLQPRAELVRLLVLVELEKGARRAAFVRGRMRLELELPPHGARLSEAGREELATPHPLERTLAVRLGPVVHAHGTRLRRDDRRRLQPVREDNVRIHGADVQVVDDGVLHPVGVVAEIAELRGDPLLDLLEVGHLRHVELLLVLDGVSERLVEAVDESLEGRRLEAELDGEVGAVDAGLEALDVAAHIRLALEQVAVVLGAEVVHLLVRADDVGVVCLDHQQRLAERPRALAQHLVWRHGDDGAEGEDEAVHVLHVQVVGRHRVRDRVRRHELRLLERESRHVLRIDFERLVPELCAADGLEAV